MLPDRFQVTAVTTKIVIVVMMLVTIRAKKLHKIKLLTMCVVLGAGWFNACVCVQDMTVNPYACEVAFNPDTPI